MTSSVSSNMCQESYLSVTKNNLSLQENIFIPLIDIEKVDLHITDVDTNIELKLLSYLKNKSHGKCNKNVYIA